VTTSIAVNGSLTLLPGTVVKMQPTLVQLIVGGQLLSLGTPQNHVVITSLRDDTVMGDTNGDGGATTPAAGDWYTINILGGGYTATAVSRSESPCGDQHRGICVDGVGVRRVGVK
jgi:hypothetical protein